MNDKRKIFNNIGDVINSAICSFWNEFGREPNKIIMSRDVFNSIVAYGNMLGVYLDDECMGNRFMGIDVEIVTDKKGFIEVGYYVHNPITVNVDYVSEGGAE
jgi:hypothetical protein